MNRFNPVFSGLGTTIFTHMSALAVQHGAVNLGQGFPDEDGPVELRAVAGRALSEGPNQYPLMRGMPPLRQAIAAHARHFYDLTYDPENEVLVTSGATEALAAAIMGLAGAGEEIVLIEPCYDSYRPIAQAVGAHIRTVTLQPPHWRLTEAALAAAITPRTRVVLINTPHNPIGRVFEAQELAALARVLAKSDAVVIADEVYEHLIYDERGHVSPAMLPELKDRVVRIGSAGKIFSLTGWKVGWVTGPRPMIDVITKAHQFLMFTTPPALQIGVAHGLTHNMDFPRQLAERLAVNRDLLAEGLSALGFSVQPCEGTYFLTAGIETLTQESDVAFCERLVREAGVALIPLSGFFSGGKPDNFVRFAFCKKRAVVEEALARLRTYFTHG